jgi:hypothetical protein
VSSSEYNSFLSCKLLLFFPNSPHARELNCHHGRVKQTHAYSIDIYRWHCRHVRCEFHSSDRARQNEESKSHRTNGVIQTYAVPTLEYAQSCGILERNFLGILYCREGSYGTMVRTRVRAWNTKRHRQRLGMCFCFVNPDIGDGGHYYRRWPHIHFLNHDYPPNAELPL